MQSPQPHFWHTDLVTLHNIIHINMFVLHIPVKIQVFYINRPKLNWHLFTGMYQPQVYSYECMSPAEGGERRNMWQTNRQTYRQADDREVIITWRPVYKSDTKIYAKAPIFKLAQTLHKEHQGELHGLWGKRTWKDWVNGYQHYKQEWD